MRKLILFILALLLDVFIINSTTESYDNEVVHQTINENAAKQSENLLSTLKNLGFNNGLDEMIFGKKIYKWFHEGARLEDETVCRSRNHFHDPLNPWNSAGLNNAAVNTYCLLLGLEKFSVDTSLIWAQKESLNPFFNNFWSWPKARNYYYKALTSTTKDEREKNFTYAFRALGQITHLIADSSVPAHVRNDIHVFPLMIPGIGVSVGSATFESWAKKNFASLPYTGIQISQSIFVQAINNSLAPVPISALWDQDKYIGSNPDITGGDSIGIAEFTNANFFSEDTIFEDYPHPAKENTNAKIIEQVAKDGKTDKVWYIQGYTSQKLAAYSYFNRWLLPDKWIYNLDTYVYQDYASQLIPRAVGYSAGLLNYFFRGELDMGSDDITGSGYVIMNNTDEDLSGTFELLYDTRNEERKSAWKSPDNFSIGKKSKSTNITFTPPNDAKEPCKYTLVFTGQMGQEQGAVVGRVLKAGECVTGRIVQASRTSDGKWIILNVFTEGGLISARFDIPNHQLVAVRFNLSNYDEFIVAAPGFQGYNFHKFTIDEPNKTINYNGLVLSLPSFKDSFYSEEVMPECTYIEENSQFCDSDGAETYKSAFYKDSYNFEILYLLDFYYDDGVIKPFGSYVESKEVSLLKKTSCNGLILYSNGGYNLEIETKRGIYYGEKLKYSVTESCTGGALPNNCNISDGSSRNLCSGTKIGDMLDYYVPIAIFNDSQYAYAHFRYSYPPQYEPPQPSSNQLIEIASPAPLNIGTWSWIYQLYGRVKTMLRQDTKQSFYDVLNSYSSELGIMDGRMLIANFSNKNIGWNSNGSIIECKRGEDMISCKTLKQIGGSFTGLFDISIKIKENN